MYRMTNQHKISSTFYDIIESMSYRYQIHLDLVTSTGLIADTKQYSGDSIEQVHTVNFRKEMLGVVQK